MVVAYGLAPFWRQGISNHHDDVYEWVHMSPSVTEWITCICARLARKYAESYAIIKKKTNAESYIAFKRYEMFLRYLNAGKSMGIICLTKLSLKVHMRFDEY